MIHQLVLRHRPIYSDWYSALIVECHDLPRTNWSIK